VGSLHFMRLSLKERRTSGPVQSRVQEIGAIECPMRLPRAVSKSIVTLVGGAIGLKSMPGEGTTVTFDAYFDLSPGSQLAPTIPNEEDLQGMPTPSIDDNATNRKILSELTRQWKMRPHMCAAVGVSASSLSLRILLAEDNLVNQKVAMTMLGKMGHRITLATNGLEALEQWRQSGFDLILMDVQMPEMTGPQATTQIRREEAIGAHVPIVAMTASAMSEERDRCLAAGMDDYFQTSELQSHRTDDHGYIVT
jgi:CheY-like chemotaxis protein